MVDAESTSEKLVSFYQTTRHNNPEDSHLILAVVSNWNLTKLVLFFIFAFLVKIREKRDSEVIGNKTGNEQSIPEHTQFPLSFFADSEFWMLLAEREDTISCINYASVIIYHYRPYKRSNTLQAL
jgi:hypothetical protein